MVTHVNGTAKAAEDKKAVARKQAGIAIQAATGIDGLRALQVVDVCMRTLQKFGLVTVGAAELDRVTETMDKMQFALVQAYVAIDTHETDRGDDACGNSEAGIRVLSLIEGVLGGKPRKVTAEPEIEPAADSSSH
jgi:hypothetical protein